MDTYTLTNATNWQHIFFNIQANLNPDNCWEPLYDKHDIRRMLITLETSPADRADTILLDAMTLTE